MTRACRMLIPVFIFAAALHAQTAKRDSTIMPPAVRIADTELLSINSMITNEKYDIYLNLPRDYGDTSKVFPVVYVLDGQWDFALVESLFGQEYYDGFVPSMVVVGITWSGANANYDSLRAGDLTPTTTKETPQGGSAPKFLRFIKNELIPLVESKYRVERSGRTLMGSSLGGLFTLYTMFNDPGLFDRYVLTSPALLWDNGVIYKYEKTYAARKVIPPARMFIGIGGYEDLAPFRQFVKLMKSRHYKGFELETAMLKGFGHSGGKAEGFSRGLQFVFKRRQASLSGSVLKEYAGSYEFPSGLDVNISVKKGLLVLRYPDHSMVTLYARNEDDFYKIGSFLFVDFKKDNEGKVTGFLQETFIGNSFAQRVRK